MKYDPNIHNRKSIRLRGYDYSQEGAYFITICTKDKELYFERYPLLKKIVTQQWNKLPERYANVTLDKFIIMPNHIHGIIIVGATLAVAHPAVAQCKNVGVTPMRLRNIIEQAQDRGQAQDLPLRRSAEWLVHLNHCVYIFG